LMPGDRRSASIEGAVHRSAETAIGRLHLQHRLGARAHWAA
jgi:hypothetical protein